MFFVNKLNLIIQKNGKETVSNQIKLEMWASAQRDGRPAEYRWRPLFNAAVWLTPTTTQAPSDSFDL